MAYLDTAEAEYRTLYQKNKWSKKDSNPDSDFVGEGDGGGCGRFSHGGRGGRGGRGNRDGGNRKRCHNCRKIDHPARTYWAPGGGEERSSPNDTNEENFPGVDGTAIRNPPRAGEPRERTLADGTTVK